MRCRQDAGGTLKKLARFGLFSFNSTYMMSRFISLLFVFALLSATPHLDRLPKTALELLVSMLPGLLAQHDGRAETRGPFRNY